MDKDTQIWFRIDTATRKHLERLADQEQRTLSNMVRLLLTQALEEYPAKPVTKETER